MIIGIDTGIDISILPFEFQEGTSVLVGREQLHFPLIQKQNHDIIRFLYVHSKTHLYIMLATFELQIQLIFFH